MGLEPFPRILNDSFLKKLDSTLFYNCKRNNVSNQSYWGLNTSTKDGMVFYTFSDYVSSTSLSFDVIGIYMGFIFLIGNAIRQFTLKEAENIVLTEMPEPQKILNLCEGIKISRCRHDFIR